MKDKLGEVVEERKQRVRKIINLPKISGRGENVEKKRKRKRCGNCAACLIKENCGHCNECINRKTGHQICRLRKCYLLKKYQTRARQNEVKTRNAKKKVTMSGENVFKRQLNDIQKAGNRIKAMSGFENNEKFVETAMAYQQSDEGFFKSSDENMIDSKIKLNDANFANGKIICKEQQSKPGQEFEAKSCDCKAESISNAPFYNQLGSAPNLTAVREMLERRFCIEGSALRIERVAVAAKEGKNLEGCPIAKWVLRRSNANEKIMVIVRERKGHYCEDRVIVVSIVIWDGITTENASNLYKRLTFLLNEHATMVTRRCGSNEKKNCCCQGMDPNTCGASFSFGCSWSMFYNGCKFGNSVSPRKYKMENPKKEEELKNLFENLATEFSQKCKMFAPKAFDNMTFYENLGSQCRIGHGKGRPFSGMTCCLDFCAHSHKDLHNTNYGTTMVLTLLKKGIQSKSHCSELKDDNDDNDDNDDEQLHVLPFYHLVKENGEVCEPNYNIPKHTLKSKIIPKMEKFTKDSTKGMVKRKPGKRRNSKLVEKKFERRYEKLDTIEINENAAADTVKEDSGVNQVKLDDEKYQSPCSIQNNELNTCENGGIAENSFDDVSYIDERNIPLMFSKTTQGFNNLKKKSVSLQEFMPKRPRLQHVDDFKLMMFRQQMPFVDNELNSKLQIKNPSGEDQDLRKRLGFKQINDKEFFPYACNELNGKCKNEIRDIETEMTSLTTNNFVTNDMGGVSIALSHGSILIECAKKEVHATTPVQNPQRQQPTRLSIIFYQHKHLNDPNHGYERNKKKMAERSKRNSSLSVNGYEAIKPKKQDKIHPLSDLELLAEAAYMKGESSAKEGLDFVKEKYADSREYCNSSLLLQMHSVGDRLTSSGDDQRNKMHQWKLQQQQWNHFHQEQEQQRYYDNLVKQQHQQQYNQQQQLSSGQLRLHWNHLDRQQQQFHHLNHQHQQQRKQRHWSFDRQQQQQQQIWNLEENGQHHQQKGNFYYHWNEQRTEQQQQQQHHTWHQIGQFNTDEIYPYFEQRQQQQQQQQHKQQQQHNTCQSLNVVNDLNMMARNKQPSALFNETQYNPIQFNSETFKEHSQIFEHRMNGVLSNLSKENENDDKIFKSAFSVSSLLGLNDAKEKEHEYDYNFLKEESTHLSTSFTTDQRLFDGRQFSLNPNERFTWIQNMNKIDGDTTFKYLNS